MGRHKSGQPDPARLTLPIAPAGAAYASARGGAPKKNFLRSRQTAIWRREGKNGAGRGAVLAPQYEGNAPSYTCLTPTGKLYAIPSRAIAAFQPGTNEWPAGCLVGYRIDNLTYYGWWDDFPSGKLFIGYAPAINGNPRLGAEIYRLSEPVDSDQVYAGIEVNCEALIMRGALPDASLYGFEASQYYPPVASLPIAHFDVLENSPMLSPGCLGGEEEWCRIRYADRGSIADSYAEE